jgi:putative RecB family exonuclease
MIAVASLPVAKEEPPTEDEIIADLLKTISASRLGLFLSCRRKFYLRYVKAVPKPKSAALHLGSVVHEVLRHWNKSRLRGKPVTVEQLSAEFTRAWEDQGEERVAWENDEEQSAEKACAQRLLETYFRETPITVDEKPEAVEVTVEKDLQAHGLPLRLIGVLDLVRPAGLIVDFKTSAKTPDPDMARHTNEIQLTGYSLLYREATDRRESGRQLHFLVKTKAPKLIVVSDGPASESQITRFLHQVESYVRGLEAHDFVPSPGLGCASCEYFADCHAHH